MKKYYLFILLILLFSCRKTHLDKQTPTTADAYYSKAKEIYANSDSAFYYFNLAKNFYLDINDSSGVSKSLVNMAIIQNNKGDYYGSIETSLEANKFLKKTKDSIVRSTLASNYNSMGTCSSYLYDFGNSLKYYTQALKYVNVPKNKYIYYNNLGDVLITLGKYKEAIKNIKLALPTTDSLNYAMVINNLARAKYYDDKTYNPLPEFNKALEIRKRNNSSIDENSSYATLANYFFHTDKKKALYYAEQMLNTAKKNKSFEDQLQALQKIINLTPNNHLVYFEEFQKLNDSVQIARNKAKNQFATIRYDVEKKNTENQTLKLQQAEKEVQLLYRNIGIGALSLSLIGGLFWYRRRKKRLQQEKELEVKNTQLKMSKKVHDVVANGIYQVMTKIENQEVFDKEEALDELEFVYEKSRDISYDKTDTHETLEFDQKISSLIGSFNNDEVKTYLAGNDKNIWIGLNDSSKNEVYQIIRELLVNMKKHSRASRVVFKFERINNKIQIQYTDNGIGISEGLVRKNGLTNTDSRIETIHGEIIFDTKTEKGLKISISFPVS
ncbi:tetratricopeptide repeat-containing sensor histidine kinase [Chryseobacterium sp.]|uniref:tetratricopeptide repeat-containing sensor histidine kinase n=1 Tax=Chryseobacterium sp. TaxID=1871047 RepID=UPI0024E26D02|nr:tetratricopeptide repeat-containing sensor histidine kinase [Chryseobacterium sp.]